MTALPILRGPADPDNFRIKVGRFKERWYHDPLPGCEIAPATDESWPSATTIKGAWPKFLHYWSAAEAAKCAVKETGNWRGMTEQGAIEYISGAHTRTRDAAGDRGTLAHQVVENLILGRPIDPLAEAQIGPWIGTLRQFVADTQPRILYSEVVTISRGLGAGGTIDAGLEFPFDRSRRWVDWKTREIGKHDPYDDDAAQLGIYTQPDAYLIVDENGRAKRIPLPKLDGGLIVTVAPDGYRLHPVNLEIAHENARQLRAFWTATRTSAIGKPIVLTTNGTVAPSSNGTASPTPDDGGLRAEHARQRLIVLAERGAPIVWPAGVQTFKEIRLSQHVYTHDELVLIETALSDAEKAIDLPFGDMVDEPQDPERLAAMIVRLEVLPADLVEQVAANAKTERIPHLRTGRVSVRHLDTLEVLVAAAEATALARVGATQGVLGEWGDDPTIAALILQLAGVTDLAAVDEQHTQWIAAVCAALDDNIVQYAVDEAGVESLVPTEKASDLLLAFGGAERSRAVAVRPIGEIAKANGLTRPRSFAAAASDPLLCALAAQSARVPA